MAEQTRAAQAKQNFSKGYNCAQAVAVAFADVIGMDEATAARLTSGYGGGMGRLREVCGSISGMVFVMNALFGYDAPKDFEGKKHLYGEIQKLAEQFRAENGSIVCRELLGLSLRGADSPVPEPRTEGYYEKRPCPALIENSAAILEAYLKEKNIL